MTRNLPQGRSAPGTEDAPPDSAASGAAASGDAAAGLVATGSAGFGSRTALPVSPVMRRLLERAALLAGTPLRVHITGETGTGKNHLAYLFRQRVLAEGRPFVEINAANLPEALFEAELFGYRRGAFTGAERDADGVLSRARGGVFFLNEVGELSEPGQAKLLTVLDTGLYRRLGDPAERTFEARLLSATNRDLRELVHAGLFRGDLYYRLAQVTLEIPPLRHRPRDIPPLLRHFLTLAASRQRISLSIERRAVRRLLRDPWPGNVRELRDVLETLVCLAPPDGRIRAAAVEDLLGHRPEPPGTPGGAPRESLRDKISRLEHREILRALIAAGGNKTVAARTLGLSVPGLRLKLRRLAIPE